jgi:protein-tyrosine-phosphatase
MCHQMTFLFVCIQNAGRSQMAAALLNAEDGQHFRGLSAGTAPADAVHPVVVDALAELQVTVTAAPQALTPALIADADRVISMGCGIADACPVTLGLRIDEEWNIPDPAGRSLDEVRAIRDTIRAKIKQLVRSA